MLHRILIQETCQYHPIHLCALKDKEPTFDDLVRKIQRITEVKEKMHAYNCTLINIFKTETRLI